MAILCYSLRRLNIIVEGKNSGTRQNIIVERIKNSRTRDKDEEMDTRVFEKRIADYIEQNNLADASNPVVIGVSGGADSVCLLRVMMKLGYEVAVVHINHMIRGKEADEDQSFVEELCRSLGVEVRCYAKDIPDMARVQGLTEEEAGRLFRYSCFEEVAKELESCYVEKTARELQCSPSEKTEKELGCNCSEKDENYKRVDVRIAVAHNRDDLAETVIYNMVRGSSLLGLAGIKPKRDNIIRPLLDVSRSEIEEYLGEIGQDFRTDSTNLSTDYTRNRIRHLIIPELKQINDQAVRHIADIAMDSINLGDALRGEIAEKTGINDAGDGYIYPDENSCISIEILHELSPMARGEYVLSVMENVCGRRKDITRNHINSVIALAEMESGKRISLPYGMTARRSYDRILIEVGSEMTKTAGENRTDTSNAETEEGHDIPEARLVIEELAYSTELEISKKEYTKMIDCDKIKNVLCLRYPRPGDYIVISSTGGRKKLSRYFTDAKIDRQKRPVISVVADGDEIVWIVGYRLSERYKITDETKNINLLSYVSEMN